MVGSLRIGFVTRPASAARSSSKRWPHGEEADEVRGGVDGRAVEELHRCSSYGRGVPARPAPAPANGGLLSLDARRRSAHGAGCGRR